jgi:uncharacterized tellurite resistance protein B-like protein
LLEALRTYLRRAASTPETTPADRERALAVATCALLLAVANADDEFDPGERELVAGMVRERFGVAGQELDGLLVLAEERRQRSIDLFEFTRLITESYDRAGRLAILELLWRVVYSDGRLESHEDALLHKLAHLLELRQDELIAVKLKVKERGAS